MNEPRRRSGDSGLERASGRARSRSEARGGSGGPRRRSSGTPAIVPVPAANQIRWSRVLTAQARIAVGYYDREDVKQRVVDALLQELKKR